MLVDFFDFNLPEKNIALRPLSNRGAAKLLHISSKGNLQNYQVKDLLSLLKDDDVLVFNNTKVLPARLFGHRYRGENIASIFVTLHKEIEENDDCWRAFIRPLKRLKIGEEIVFHKKESLNQKKDEKEIFILKAILVEKYQEGEVCLRFNAKGKFLKECFFDYGVMPLPPYISSRRDEDHQDERDYQTIFAKHEGAVASPTAGLHFDENLLEVLKQKVDIVFVTLHVGAGTFFPVKVDDTSEHVMHKEYAYLDEKTANFLNLAKKEGRRIIAVGTTSLRVLESAAVSHHKVIPYQKETDIFITPGYDFLFVDALITNFHLPRSTLFMLVSAFCGLETMQRAYQYAIDNGYRFYSYGDTSFLEKSEII